MSVLIIAEVGSVHDGSQGNALKLIEAAAECGVDAVKFQTHIPEAETIRNAPAPPYFKGEPRFEYFQRTGFTLQQWQQIKSHCDEHGVIFLSSPFSDKAVDLLEEVNMTHYKIPSGEVTNLPMLDKIARTQKPIFLSSGMNSWQELDTAVETIRTQHNQIVILQCTSEYPCPYDKVGLNVLAEMRNRYGCEVGLSDHTLTNYAVFAAVTLGAVVIEKHFAFSRKMYGSDAKHSLEPPEMADMVKGVRAIEQMLANPVDKNDLAPYQQMKDIFQKSLVAAQTIPAGTPLDESLIAIKKPGTGIPAARLKDILGKKTLRDIPKDTLLSLDDLSD